MRLAGRCHVWTNSFRLKRPAFRFAVVGRNRRTCLVGNCHDGSEEVEIYAESIGRLRPEIERVRAGEDWRP
jgi:hypothetical protein